MADTSTISPSPVSSTASSLAKLKNQSGGGASLLSGAGYSILNAGGSLLDAGRRINRSGIGMSANSRAALEGFFNNASAIFNQLYTKAENSEVTNQMQILALRSKYAYLAEGGVFDENRNVTPSSTGGTVDTSA
jgi:hypothetical protein